MYTWLTTRLDSTMLLPGTCYKLHHNINLCSLLFRKAAECHGTNCSCDRSWWCGNPESKRKALERCQAKHVDEASPLLSDTRPHLSSTIFAILSHSGNHGVHNPLVQGVQNIGASKIDIVYGFHYGIDEQMGRQLKAKRDRALFDKTPMVPEARVMTR